MDEGDTISIDIINAAAENEINEEKRSKAIDTYKNLREFKKAWEQKNATRINRLSNIQISVSTPEAENQFREHVNKLLSDHFNEFQSDKNEVYFMAAAKFMPKELEETITHLTKEELNQLRLSDSALVFALKYGDLNDDNFLKCVEILVGAGIDINKYDIRAKTALDYIAQLYDTKGSNPKLSENLKKAAELLLNKGIFRTDDRKTKEFIENVMGTNLANYNFSEMDDHSRLFYCILKNQTEEFLNIMKKKNIDVNCNNGEETILQFVSHKSDNMLPIVQCLLKNKADPNKVKWNKLTPLELAGIHNHQKIFAELLKHKSTTIDQKQYNNFVKSRSSPMKTKLFELLLESDKLDPSFIYDTTGNTPLHYAIIFSHKKAVQTLLKRGSLLCVKNKFDKSCLDIIDQKDLEDYFDSCLTLDNYAPYFSDINYKMKFRFNCLIDNIHYTEMHILSKIGKIDHLQHLLKHPFIHTFICLKWFKTKYYFKVALLSQALLFASLSYLLYHLPDFSAIGFTFCILLSIFNCAIKATIFLNFKTRKGSLDFFVLEQVKMHGAVELLLIITILGSFFQNQIRAFVFAQMAISFLLTAGYHPQLSKWSLMLQRVFKTFTILLLFFSLIVFAFSMGFRILFKHDEVFFGDFYTSLFKTFMMTTGEFEVSETKFESGFGGYLLFLVFAMSMSLVIVNFWTGVAVTDIERIEKDSEINAFINVIKFMSFVDYIYNRKCLRMLRKYIPTPLLFLCIGKNGIYHDPEKCNVDFFVNKARQFETKAGFPEKIDNDCFSKIGLHYHKLKKVTSEARILSKLEALEKLINELKAASKNQHDPTGTIQKNKKDPKKNKN